MDQTGAALVEAIEPYGFTAILVVLFLFVFILVVWKGVLPMVDKTLTEKRAIERLTAEANIELEKERERRKAEESERQSEENKQRAENDGKILVVMEGTKASIDAMNTTMTAFLARINESGNRSLKMGDTVEDTNRKVTEIHHELIGR